MLFCFLGLLVLVAIAFASLPSFSFVNYDDSSYLIKNPYIANGLTPQGVQWAFAIPSLSRNADRSPFWRPIPYLSHMLDFQLFGQNAGSHHAMNLFFHLLNVFLLFLILAKSTDDLFPSWMAAAIFAVHPLQVEPVAWISARNVLLSMFFALLTIGFYTRFLQKHSRLSYGISILCFILCLFSKSTLVGLPLLLLLWDFWPLKRSGENAASWFRCAIEKRLWILLAGGAALLAIGTEPEALRPALSQPFLSKIMHSLFAYGFYLSKVFCPVGLTLFYPNMPEMTGALLVLFVLVCFVWAMITWTAWSFRTRYPFFFTGWAWFLIALFPASLLPQKADRYMYEPLVGLAILGGWFLSSWVQRMGRAKLWSKIGIIGILLGLAGWSHVQTQTWQNSITLYQHALKIYPDTFEARMNLGNAFGEAGKTNEAMEQFTEAIKLSPNSPGPYESLGNVFLMKENNALAEEAFRKSLELNPQNANVWRMMGWFAQMRGAFDAALECYARSLAIMEDSWLTHAEVGALYEKLGNKAAATSHYAQSLKYHPGNPQLRLRLQNLLAEPVEPKKT